MASGKVILRNLTANWISFGISLVVMFFLAPFILHSLGIVEYGIWQLLTILAGYMGILDLGVRASTGRYIIFYLGKKDSQKVDETIRTGLGFYTCLSGLILLAGIVIGHFFHSLFPSVPEEYQSTIMILLPALAIKIWISAFRIVLASILTAYDRFDLARSSDLVLILFRTVGTIITLKLEMGLTGLVFALIVCNIAGLILNLSFSKRIHKGLKLWPLLLKKERMKELYTYGIGAFIVAASVKIIGQTDLVLVGNLIGIDSVAVYSVGAMLILYSGTLLDQIGVVYFPTLQKAVVRKDIRETQSILYRLIHLSLILGLLIYIGYISFGKVFINLWMFQPESFSYELVVKASQVMIILSFSKILLLLTSFSKSILPATGKIGFASKMTITEAILNLLLSIVFVVVFDLGLIGIASGTLVSTFLIQTLIVPGYACKAAGLSWIRILVEIGSKAVLSGILFWGSCHYIQTLYRATNWILFFSQVGMAVMLYLPITWLLLVPYREKFLIKNKIRNLVLTMLHRERI